MDQFTFENIYGVAVFLLNSTALFMGIPLGLIFGNWLLSWVIERWG